MKKRRKFSRKGVSARIVGWRRGVSLAFAGMAAVLFVMTASAGPASALLERTRLNPDGTPRRLTDMPEEIYQRREALQEFVSVSYTFFCFTQCAVLVSFNVYLKHSFSGQIL